MDSQPHAAVSGFVDDQQTFSAHKSTDVTFGRNTAGRGEVARLNLTNSAHAQ